MVALWIVYWHATNGPRPDLGGRSLDESLLLWWPKRNFLVILGAE
jgi:hypothetical protein